MRRHLRAPATCSASRRRRRAFLKPPPGRLKSGWDVSREQPVRVPHLRHPTLQARQAPRYGDIDRGSNGCFGFRTCGLRGASSASRTGPTSTSASGAAATSDLVDQSAGLMVPASVHTATGAGLAQARAVVPTAQLIYMFWNTGDTTFLDQAVSPDSRATPCPPDAPGPGWAHRGLRGVPHRCS
ncbi:MAG: hypothetical protein QOE41_1493 [Mycobacterium sp.]|jgi:hypothetical protein|nr:ester cyclase [Mycobacterium sp.]MDT5132182.1 hypothetical protein [Mycobacterium sp.]